MNDPITLRKQLRIVLATAPRRRDGRRFMAESMLKIALERLLGTAVTVPEFREAVEWNHSRNLVEYERDEDLETDQWELTAKGREKEGL